MTSTTAAPASAVTKTATDVNRATCWIISDGKAGVETQCLAVAEGLGLAPVLKRVAPRRPWRWLAPYGSPDPSSTPGASGSKMMPPWPDIVIAGGRMTVPSVRALRRAAGPSTFTVFLQDPRTGPDTADVIWVPEHDRRRGANVFTTLTTPHRLTLAKLDARRASPPTLISEMPGPRLSVLIGGDSRSHTFTTDDQARLLRGLDALAAHFGSVFLTTSRRTPTPLADALAAFMIDRAGLFWDGTGDNPLHDFIAHADQLVVTADSANMVCEACVTGCPVHVFHPSGGARKFNWLHEALTAYGATRPMVETYDSLDAWTYTPLSATEDIAAEIAARWTTHRRTNQTSAT